MTKKIFVSSLCLIAVLNFSYAQDSTKSPLKISGSVDAYYRASSSEMPTSFTNRPNTFQLGMASVKAEYTTGKVGVVADLGFGKRAEEFSYADEGTLQALKQAYIYFAPSDKVKFTFGKFGTHVGYELLDPQLNKNYSMSYMFTNGPFSHTGLKADFTLGSGVGLMIGLANPIDVTAPDNGYAPKTLIAQLSKVASNYSLFLNYAGYSGAKHQMPGASALSQIGLTATITASDVFSIGYDGTVQFVKDETISKTKTWWGSAVYLNLTASKDFGLTLRSEYFGDRKYGIKTGTNIFATTLSGNYKVGGFILIPELRFDSAKDAIYAKALDGAPGKSAFSFIMAAVYSF